MRDQPIENIGGRETFDTTIVRRYLCHACGYAFYTREVHLGPINRRVRSELAAQNELFDGD